MLKSCLTCGKEFNAKNQQVYCGSRRKKEGCAYTYDLEKHKSHYQEKRDDILPKVKAYYSKNKSKISARMAKWTKENADTLKKKHLSYYSKNRNQILEEKKSYHLMKKYGLSQQAYRDLLEAQGGVCLICKCNNNNGRRLYVDHCHDTGRIRGLLCYNCNAAIGMMKEDIYIMESAIKYIKYWEKENAKN